MLLPTTHPLDRGVNSSAEGRNPSSFAHRGRTAGLAFAGFLVALPLALYQLGWTHFVWDPIFGPDATVRVLTSPVSRALPFPDAAAGALVYLLEAVLALVGPTTRWRTNPWLVVVSSGIVCGSALASLALVILQPTVARAWCTLCLLSALISFLLLASVRAELAASLRLLLHPRHAGIGPGEKGTTRA